MATYGRSAASFGQKLLQRHSKRTFKSHIATTYTQFVRHRWFYGRTHNPDDDILPPYAERLAAWEAARDNSPPSTGINIGLPFISSTNKSNSLEKVRTWTKNRHKLEVPARHHELAVDLETVNQEWKTESGPRHIRTMAEHYGIFRDMFDGAHFDAVVPMDIWYDYDEEFITPVKYGNIVPALEASMSPSVDYESEDSSLWTLVMTSPDQNLEDQDRELLHWAVTNIPGNVLDKGETVCDFLQPFPVKGAGFLRYVFVLYKQATRLDLPELQRPKGCVSLRARSFSSYEFLRQHEDELTPAGLAFHQSEWDPSVRSVFHNVLDMPEPKFEFLHPPTYFPAQDEFPHNQSFNEYLDNYRDIKDLNEEVLKYKLKDVDPTQPPPPPLKYNCIDKVSTSMPSWYRVKVQHQRSGKLHWKKLYEEPKE